MMPNHPKAVSSDMEDEIMEVSPNKITRDSDTTSTLTSDDSVDLEPGSFIRIKSQGDGIFEDDDDDDEFYDQFHPPEVVLGSPPTRKRKQEMNFRDTDFNKIVKFCEEPEFKVGNYLMEQDIFQMRRRDRMPLYLLDPADYPHDPQKRFQIRRAIVTYRHHQGRKEQIIMLTEESKKLREHNEALKTKVLELASCGCKKAANLDVLNVTIPVVPPIMFIRGNRPVLAVPYNKVQMSSNTNLISTGNENPRKSQSIRSTIDSLPTPVVKVPEVPKPLMNIVSSRLQQISSSTFSSVNVTSHDSRLPSSHVTIPGNRITASQGVPRATNFLQKGIYTTAAARGPGKPEISSIIQIESDPGNVSNQSHSNTPSASRITFAKASPNKTGSPQTASQLLFASKLTAAMKSNSLNVRLTPQRLISGHTATSISANKNMSFLKSAPTIGTLLRTNSGQVLRVVQTPGRQSNLLQLPSKAQPPKFQPILPKPEPPKEFYNSRNKNILRSSNGTEIELNKYADIVFEEAD